MSDEDSFELHSPSIGEPGYRDPINNGGPAFPRPASEYGHGGHYEQDGMSLRDYFAGQALVGFTEAFLSGGWHNPNEYQIEVLARNSYLAADAMLKARGGSNENS